MKDVAACDKPRGVGKRTLIRGFPNGETCFVEDETSRHYVDVGKGTRGSETSQYPEEKRITIYSLSSGERKGKSLNLIESKLIARSVFEQNFAFSKRQ